MVFDFRAKFYLLIAIIIDVLNQQSILVISIMKKNTDYSIPENLRGKKLKITNGNPLTEAFLNNYFQLFSVDFLLEFEKIYNKLEHKLKAIGMDPDAFMSQIKDTYNRFQEYKQLDAFTPIDKKGFKYVKDYVAYSSKSKHLQGIAADIVVKGINTVNVYQYLNNQYKDRYGIGSYDTFTHIDVRSLKGRW